MLIFVNLISGEQLAQGRDDYVHALKVIAEAQHRVNEPRIKAVTGRMLEQATDITYTSSPVRAVEGAEYLTLHYGEYLAASVIHEAEGILQQALLPEK